MYRGCRGCFVYVDWFRLWFLFAINALQWLFTKHLYGQGQVYDSNSQYPCLGKIQPVSRHGWRYTLIGIAVAFMTLMLVIPHISVLWNRKIWLASCMWLPWPMTKLSAIKLTLITAALVVVPINTVIGRLSLRVWRLILKESNFSPLLDLPIFGVAGGRRFDFVALLGANAAETGGLNAGFSGVLPFSRYH